MVMEDERAYECQKVYLRKEKMQEITQIKKMDEQWKMPDDFNSMLEVFGILYLGRDDIEPQNQLGRISIDCPNGIIRHIYNVTEVDETRDTLTTGDEFDVMDIKSPFPYLQECTNLEFDLFGGAYKGDLYSFFEKTLFGTSDDAFIEELRLESRDGTGEIIVLMGFYAHATIAQVEVGHKNSTGKVVYGSIAASNNLLDQDLATSLLFFKDERQGITVETDGLIPLARSRVAVPFPSVLFLDISLQVAGQPLSATFDFPAHKIGLHDPPKIRPPAPQKIRPRAPQSIGDLWVRVKWNALNHDSEEGMELD